MLGWNPYERRETIEALGAIYPLDGAYIRPFHSSLTDWITDERAAGPYWVSRQMGHSRLADLGASLHTPTAGGAPAPVSDAVIVDRAPPATAAHRARQFTPVYNPVVYDDENRFTHLLQARRFDDFRRMTRALTDDLGRGDAEARRQKRAKLENTLRRAARDWPADASPDALAAALVEFAEAGSHVGNPGEMQYIISRALSALIDGMNVRPELSSCLPDILPVGLIDFLRHPAAEIDMAAYSTLDVAIRRAFAAVGSDPLLRDWARPWKAYLE
jgi:hypothetical protein